ncbi:bifunctional 4-hydroxy-2-oxoglutarate aldolase/2-dehydro-3-deoxy-phosphogluconate aldolase [Nocardioidaceae bacterium SCSIO 66511]|nr:bifunctional 4-hydroxy-2-oxoglutarate aldolase/2-dehydro-3-deoxy-phosphogluconate aldolase [Nocardioidaceae bacterium SCSIO 66511]
MTAADLPSANGRSKLIAILRGGNGHHLETVATTLIASGIDCLEITTNTPGFEKALSTLRERYDDEVRLGLGTVRSVEHVSMATRLGAEFVVAPTTQLEVGRAAKDAGLEWYPGAMTPTEVETAWQAGADAVKVFPAAQAGGPAFVRALLAPLDDVRIIPTGGVDVENVTDYLRAGAAAVGVGSPLIADSLHTGDLDDVARRAEQFRLAVTEVAR